MAEARRNPGTGVTIDEWPVVYVGMSTGEIAGLADITDQWVRNTIGQFVEPDCIRVDDNGNMTSYYIHADALAFGVMRLRVPAMRGTSWAATQEDFDAIRGELTQDNLLLPELRDMIDNLTKAYLDGNEAFAQTYEGYRAKREQMSLVERETLYLLTQMFNRMRDARTRSAHTHAQRLIRKREQVEKEINVAFSG